MSNDQEKLIRALRSLPAPEPRPEFVERAFATATDRSATAGSRLRRLASAWELWVGAGLGGALAASLTFLMLRPVPMAPADEPALSLALNETREIDVVIESERHLEDATIRIAVMGGIALDGFENKHEIDWQADLEQGTNLLTLPVVARGKGGARLVAVVEHEGKKRTITVDLTVTDPEASES